MSICVPCLKAKPVPTCTVEIVLGTVAANNTAVMVYVEDVSSGLLFAFPTTTGAGGEVAVDVSEIEFFENHSYLSYVTLANASLNDPETLTLGTDTTDYVCIRFRNVKLDDGTMETYSTITLEAE